MQKPSSLRLTPLEGKLMAWVQMRELRCADSGRVQRELRLTPRASRELLDKMNKRGLIIQLQRGLYLFPDKLPPGGTWQPSAELAICYYLSYKKAEWQETGPAVFQYHRLSEQIANASHVYNDRVSGAKTFGKLKVQFIKVSTNRIGHFEEIDMRDDPLAFRRVGTLPRVVFDAIYDYSRFDSATRAYEWIEQRISDTRFIKELVACAVGHGNVASRRRIGWAIESLGAKKSLWKPLYGVLKPTRSFIPIDPTKPSRGKINRLWGVLENE